MAAEARMLVLSLAKPGQNRDSLIYANFVIQKPTQSALSPY
jgi:hypothetical protein